MADVAQLLNSTPSQPQLPVSWYFDPEIFEAEKRLLFQAGANYVGHELMVPNAGDWHTLAWTDHAKVLVRNAGGVELLSNVCRHRQAIMLQGRGNAENIVCPVHRWTYDLKGELLGAPRFADQPCVKLAFHAAQATGTGCSSRDRATRQGSCAHHHDGRLGLQRLRARLGAHRRIRQMNWKTFIETYLEVYHVDPFHPGLGNFTDCENFTVDYGADYSVQIVAAKAGLARPGTPSYKRWHEACLKHLDGRAPKYGALWATYYPGLTFEWYPNVLVVSTSSRARRRAPRTWSSSILPEEIALFEREFIEAQQAAYVETAIEDNEICLRLDRGRRALYEQGLDDAGPYQSPMEDPEVHFHEWLHARLDR